MNIGKQHRGNRWEITGLSIRAKTSLEALGGSVVQGLGGKWGISFPEGAIILPINRDLLRVLISETIFSLHLLPGRRRRSSQRIVLLLDVDGSDDITNPHSITWAPKQLIWQNGEDTNEKDEDTEGEDIS